MSATILGSPVDGTGGFRASFRDLLAWRTGLEKPARGVEAAAQAALDRASAFVDASAVGAAGVQRTWSVAPELNAYTEVQAPSLQSLQHFAQVMDSPPREPRGTHLTAQDRARAQGLRDVRAALPPEDDEVSAWALSARKSLGAVRTTVAPRQAQPPPAPLGEVMRRSDGLEGALVDRLRQVRDGTLHESGSPLRSSLVEGGRRANTPTNWTFARDKSPAVQPSPAGTPPSVKSFPAGQGSPSGTPLTSGPLPDARWRSAPLPSSARVPDEDAFPVSHELAAFPRSPGKVSPGTRSPASREDREDRKGRISRGNSRSGRSAGAMSNAASNAATNSDPSIRGVQVKARRVRQDVVVEDGKGGLSRTTQLTFPVAISSSLGGASAGAASAGGFPSFAAGPAPLITASRPLSTGTISRGGRSSPLQRSPSPVQGKTAPRRQKPMLSPVSAPERRKKERKEASRTIHVHVPSARLDESVDTPLATYRDSERSRSPTRDVMAAAAVSVHATSEAVADAEPTEAAAVEEVRRPPIPEVEEPAPPAQRPVLRAPPPPAEPQQPTQPVRARARAASEPTDPTVVRDDLVESDEAPAYSSAWTPAPPGGWTPEARAVLDEHLAACEEQMRVMEEELARLPIPPPPDVTVSDAQDLETMVQDTHELLVQEGYLPVNAEGPARPGASLQALDDEMGELMKALELSARSLQAGLAGASYGDFGARSSSIPASIAPRSPPPGGSF